MSEAVWILESSNVDYGGCLSYQDDDIEKVILYIESLERQLAEVSGKMDECLMSRGLLIDGEKASNGERDKIIQTLYDDLATKEAVIKKLEREIDVLRIYGNKDCTVMADEHLNNPTE